MVNFYNAQNKNVVMADKAEPSVSARTSPAIPSDKKVKSQDTGKYFDPTGEFSAKQFKWAVWFVKNKLLLYRLSIGFLIVFSAVTIVFSFWRGAQILIFDLSARPGLEAALTASINYSALHPRFSPLPLQILNSYVLPGGTGKTDVLSEIANPNKNFVVRFDYYFDYGGSITERRADFLLPGESRPVAEFGIDTAQFPGSPSLMLENIRWERVPAHQIPDAAAWQTERVDFTVSNFSFSFAGENGLAANALRFTVRNNSPYGYRDALFYLGLYQNGGLVGIMRFDLKDFQSLESREIDLRNFVQNLAVSEIKLYPVIDLYDKGAYLPPKG